MKGPAIAFATDLTREVLGTGEGLARTGRFGSLRLRR
jgi:hypothetical protein